MKGDYCILRYAAALWSTSVSFAVVVYLFMLSQSMISCCSTRDGAATDGGILYTDNSQPSSSHHSEHDVAATYMSNLYTSHHVCMF